MFTKTCLLITKNMFEAKQHTHVQTKPWKKKKSGKIQDKLEKSNCIKQTKINWKKETNNDDTTQID